MTKYRYAGDRPYDPGRGNWVNYPRSVIVLMSALAIIMWGFILVADWSSHLP